MRASLIIFLQCNQVTINNDGDLIVKYWSATFKILMNRSNHFFALQWSDVLKCLKYRRNWNGPWHIFVLVVFFTERELWEGFFPKQNTTPTHPPTRGILIGKSLKFCMLPNCSHLLTDFRTVFVFALRDTPLDTIGRTRTWPDGQMAINGQNGHLCPSGHRAMGDQ